MKMVAICSVLPSAYILKYSLKYSLNNHIWMLPPKTNLPKDGGQRQGFQIWNARARVFELGISALAQTASAAYKI